MIREYQRLVKIPAELWIKPRMISVVAGYELQVKVSGATQAEKHCQRTCWRICGESKWETSCSGKMKIDVPCGRGQSGGNGQWQQGWFEWGGLEGGLLWLQINIKVGGLLAKWSGSGFGIWQEYKKVGPPRNRASGAVVVVGTVLFLLKMGKNWESSLLMYLLLRREKEEWDVQGR